jgi:excisionase family DNA binding protein
VPDDLTTPAAAAALGIHPDTLARWAKQGLVPHWRTPAGHRRFRRQDIEALRDVGTSDTSEQVEAAS